MVVDITGTIGKSLLSEIPHYFATLVQAFSSGTFFNPLSENSQEVQAVMSWHGCSTHFYQQGNHSLNWTPLK